VSAENRVTSSDQHLSAGPPSPSPSRVTHHDRFGVAFGLAYQMLARMLSWLALLARSDTAKDAEIL